jgi:hypothetical protein
MARDCGQRQWALGSFVWLARHSSPISRVSLHLSGVWVRTRLQSLWCVSKFACGIPFRSEAAPDRVLPLLAVECVRENACARYHCKFGGYAWFAGPCQSIKTSAAARFVSCATALRTSGARSAILGVAGQTCVSFCNGHPVETNFAKPDVFVERLELAPSHTDSCAALRSREARPVTVRSSPMASRDYRMAFA